MFEKLRVVRLICRRSKLKINFKNKRTKQENKKINKNRKNSKPK